MKIPLGELLIESGIITVKTLERALARQLGSGGLLGIVLEEMGVITREELTEALAKQAGIGTAKAGPGHAPRRNNSLRILVVDDSADITSDMQEALMKEGYQVLTANDGVEGLRMAFSQNPDLILCDAAMPRMDGYSLMRAVKANPSSAGTPMILLTSKASPEEEHRALKSGFHDFIAKPTMTIRLVSRVKRAFDILHRTKPGRTIPAA